MDYIKERLVIKSDKTIRLNPWTGSTLRGAISNRLLQDCIRKDTDCSLCELSMGCPVSLLFNNRKLDDNSINPIVINTNYYDMNGIITNIIEFELVLFGYGIVAYNTIIDTLEKGVYINGNVFKLMNHTKESKVKTLKNIEVGNKIRVNIGSPLNLRWLPIGSKFEFKDLMKAILIRTKMVYNTLGIECEYSYMDLLEKAESVKLLNQEIKYNNMIRKSYKNGKNSVKCLTGYMEYEGEFEEFIPYLTLASIVNIGKWCSMGLGKISIENVN